MLTVEYQISTDTSFLFAQIRCLQSAGWCAFFHIVVYLCRRREKKIIEMASDWTKYSINSFLWNAVNFSPIFFSSPIPDPISCCIIIITHATNSVYTVCIEQFSVQSLNIKEVRAHPSLIWFRLSRAMYLCSPGCCLTAWLAKLWCLGPVLLQASWPGDVSPAWPLLHQDLLLHMFSHEAFGLRFSRSTGKC